LATRDVSSTPIYLYLSLTYLFSRQVAADGLRAARNSHDAGVHLAAARLAAHLLAARAPLTSWEGYDRYLVPKIAPPEIAPRAHGHVTVVTHRGHVT